MRKVPLPGQAWVSLDVAESLGGLSANIACHSTKEIKEILAWCVYLLRQRKKEVTHADC